MPGGRASTAAMLDGSGPLNHVAIDGVSCTLCHQITPEGLGEPGSYSGRFAIGDGDRLFGPHDSPFAMPMLNHTGYRPVEGDHVLGSALCGSCHTLFTDAVDAQGRPVGRRLAEQTPYLEWRNSAFSTEVERPGPAAADCQDCHAPKTSARGATLRSAVARNPHGFDFPPVGEREPFGRHLFVGGNTLVPAMLLDHAEVLRPGATSAGLQATIAAAREQLETRTARVSVERLWREGSELHVDVAVWNLSGHKFPTGHPSRRAWLRLRVTNAGGEALFSSGGVDASGRLVGPRGAPLSSERPGGKPHPHRRVIDRPDRVQVYEAVMADESGRPTYLLMRGARYVKDNRLLPRGWSSTHPGIAEIAPRGLRQDGDFVGGEDVTRYVVEVGDAPGPFHVEASLLYQSAGARYLAELLEFDTPQVRALRRLYDSADRTPALVASDTRSGAP